MKSIAQALDAISRVAELKPLAALATTEDDTSRQGERLVKGQSYPAQVLSRLDARTVQVAIQGQTMAVALQTGLQAGQTIHLQYLGDHPAPMFKLLPQVPTGTADTASLSRAAQLINQHLQTVKNDPNAQVFQAVNVVASAPVEAAPLAAALKRAVAESGLFYEAHLAEFVEGERSLADIKLEAQSREQYPVGPLLVKQLAILENQRLMWHGEIWPGQHMEWQVQREGLERGGQERETASEGESAIEVREVGVSSSLALQLPNLGKVTARIMLSQGALHIQLSAEQAETASRLGDARTELLSAMEAQVQPVTSFAVVRDA